MAYSPGVSNPFGFTVTPWVKKLMIANAVAFVITLAFGGLVSYLAFTPARLIPQVWTVFTYMFVHVGVFHLLFNMLSLFFFGPPLEERWGGSEFLKFYLISGLGGAALSFIFPQNPIVGASGAIYGVMVAFAMYWPDNPIYIWGIFPVKAKWLVGFLVGLSLFYAISGGGSIAHLAHLGGAMAAFIYLRSRLAPSPWGTPAPRRKKQRDWNVLRSLGGSKSGPRPAPAQAPEVKRAVVAARPVEARRSADDVDRILDKISAGGIASLTEEERRHLEEASKKFRSN